MGKEFYLFSEKGNNLSVLVLSQLLEALKNGGKIVCVFSKCSQEDFDVIKIHKDTRDF